MKVKVALFLSTTSNAQILVDATHYANNMTGNALFNAAEVVAQVTATNTAITGLRTAMNAATSDSKTDAIRQTRDVLDRNLTILAGKVEAIANNPTIPDEQREGIIHSAGMETRGLGSPKKRVFSVDNSDTDGSAYLTAAGGANAHEWQYTNDVINFTNRTAALTTTTATTEITGLNRGMKYAFFHKAIMPGQITDWEGPLFLIVS
jgi:hypothetical protein